MIVKAYLQIVALFAVCSICGGVIAPALISQKSDFAVALGVLILILIPMVAYLTIGKIHKSVTKAIKEKNT